MTAKKEMKLSERIKEVCKKQEEERNAEEMKKAEEFAEFVKNNFLDEFWELKNVGVKEEDLKVIPKDSVHALVVIDDLVFRVSQSSDSYSKMKIQLECKCGGCGIQTLAGAVYSLQSINFYLKESADGRLLCPECKMKAEEKRMAEMDRKLGEAVRLILEYLYD